MPVLGSMTGQGLPQVFGAVVPDHLGLAPRPAAIAAARSSRSMSPESPLDDSAAFAEGEQGAFPGDDQGWNAVGVISLLAGDEDRRLVDRLLAMLIIRGNDATDDQDCERAKHVLPRRMPEPLFWYLIRRSSPSAIPELTRPAMAKKPSRLASFWRGIEANLNVTP